MDTDKIYNEFNLGDTISLTRTYTPNGKYELFAHRFVEDSKSYSHKDVEQFRSPEYKLERQVLHDFIDKDENKIYYGFDAIKIGFTEVDRIVEIDFDIQKEDKSQVDTATLNKIKSDLKALLTKNTDAEIDPSDNSSNSFKLDDKITLNQDKITTSNGTYKLFKKNDDNSLEEITSFEIKEDSMNKEHKEQENKMFYRKNLVIQYKENPPSVQDETPNPQVPNQPQPQTPTPNPQPQPQPNPAQPQTPQEPSTPTQPISPITEAGSSTEDENPSDTTPISQVPGENPPTGIPFVPSTIVNPELIADIDEPVLTIINEEETPLGDANVNLGEGTYTFIEEDVTPLGTAKIHDDNTLEILEINEDLVAKSLPKTGEQDNSLMTLLGTSLLGVGVLLKRKKK